MTRVISRSFLGVTRFLLVSLLAAASPLHADSTLRTLAEQYVAAIAAKNEDKQLELLNQIIKEDPGIPGAYSDRAIIYAKRGHEELAIADFDQAIWFDSKNSILHQDRALTYSLIGNYSQACVDYRAAVRFDPQNKEALNQFARLLAACPQSEIRDGAKAVELAKEACHLTKWKDADALDALAAADAEQGDYDSAVKFESQALLLFDPKNPNVVEAKNRLDRYKNKQPFRFTSGEIARDANVVVQNK